MGDTRGESGTGDQFVFFGSTNEDFGSSGISLCDLNRDGPPDILLTNGDGFDYAEPGARPWHGVQWLENRGGGKFRQQRIGDLLGAYSVFFGHRPFPLFFYRLWPVSSRRSMNIE